MSCSAIFPWNQKLDKIYFGSSWFWIQMTYQSEMNEEDEIREIRFELCAGWQMEGQVRYLREFIGQHKPEVSDRLVFTEYNDTRFIKVPFRSFSHVETTDISSDHGIHCSNPCTCSGECKNGKSILCISINPLLILLSTVMSCMLNHWVRLYSWSCQSPFTFFKRLRETVQRLKCISMMNLSFRKLPKVVISTKV